MKILDSAFLAKWEHFDPGPEEAIHPPWGVGTLFIKRLDMVTSWGSGNKYYKLKYNIHTALEDGRRPLISKGGMYSNHLEALATACAYFSIPCICIIRSYTPDETNPTIQTLRQCNAEIIFTSPEEYEQFDAESALELAPEALFIPEGGANESGLKGASEIFRELKNDYTHLILAGGTFSTAAGIIAAAGDSTKIIIVPAWKGCTLEYLTTTLHRFGVRPECKMEIWPDYHFGGFGKFNSTLVQFMFEFTTQTGIPLDPVYNSKMMFAIRDKMEHGFFSSKDTILALHTGGLQGLEGAAHRSPGIWKEYLRFIGRKSDL